MGITQHLTLSCLQRLGPPDYFDDISLIKANLRTKMKEKCRSKSNTKLLYKYFLNLWLFSKLLRKVSKVRTTYVKEISGYECNFQKKIEGEMLIEIQPTTPLQIFCELMINFKDILKSIEGADDTCQGDLWIWMQYFSIGNISLTKANFWKKLMEKCWSKSNPQLFFKYFGN